MSTKIIGPVFSCSTASLLVLNEITKIGLYIIATRAKQNFMVTKATGKKGQTGVIGIPNIEKCTLTCVHTGFIEILDEEKNVLGTMGPGAKFHYGILQEGMSWVKPELGRVDYLGKPIPPLEVCERIASYTHVLLRTSSEESIFYCCHDPKDMHILYLDKSLGDV